MKNAWLTARFVNLRGLIMGALLGFTFAACAGVTFSYHYYGLSAATFAGGTLLGPKASDDLPFTQCQPTSSNASPCTIMFTAEFLAMKQDYLSTKNQLITCQKGSN